MLQYQKSKNDLVFDRIRRFDEPDLVVTNIPGKGKGVVAGVAFPRGHYVCEYSGDLMRRAEALEREQMYEKNNVGSAEVMCYMYYFKHAGRVWCVDATRDDGRAGRLINHSRKSPNLKPRLFIVDGRPRLGFVTARDIEAGEELLYDYGERCKDIIAAFPWLRL